MVRRGQCCAVITILLFAAARGQGFEPELERRRQRDTVGDLFDPGAPDVSRCDRRCVEGEPPRVCYYHFTLENYHTMGAACGSCPNITSDCLRPQCVTADGYERGILTVNRRLPGPSIQVCQGDRVVVDVMNMMPGRTTTIHWHGILQQGTPFMDGVPMVTQCPITEDATFRYNFVASHAGTHFWHSHDGLQKMDGILGTLIVRMPKALDPNANTYDFDIASHNMIVVDWMSTDADQKLPGWRVREPGQEPVSYLINGRGRLPAPVRSRRKRREATFYDPPQSHRRIPSVFKDHFTTSIEKLYTASDFESPYSDNSSRIFGRPTTPNTSYLNLFHSLWPFENVFPENNNNNRPRPPSSPRPPTRPNPPTRPTVPSRPRPDGRVPRTPYAVFVVAQGQRFRFRLVGGMCLHCPAEISIENHRLRLISTDGTSIVPVYVNKIVFLPGERFDFVVEAFQRVGSYWIHVKGLGPCRAVSAYQVGVLRYDGSNSVEPTTREPGYTGFPDTGITFNPVGARCGPQDTGICVSQLRTALPVNPRLLGRPDIQLVFGFDFYTFNPNLLFRPGNYQKFLQPPVPVVVGGMINNISNTLAASPLLTQLRDIPPNKFCAPGQFGPSECPIDYCECLNLVRVPQNALVELVFADLATTPGELHHPFHLHGHEFYVVAMGVFPAQLRGREGLRRLKDGRLKMERLTLPTSRQRPGTWFTAKDTVAVPSAGYAGVRFIADNPGYWSVHCHFIYHQVVGMNLVLQVGDHAAIPQPQPRFQTCGDYAPPVNFNGFQ